MNRLGNIYYCSQDYYPFGMVEPGRSFSLAHDSSYRFGFNGMLKDNDIYGQSNAYTTEFRGYDPRLGRWWSTDPKEKDFASETPYNNNHDNPILNEDPNGDCPWCIGAAVGGLLDAGLQLAEIGLDKDKHLSDFSFAEVGISAAAGAIGVGLADKAEKIFEVGKLATTAIKVAISAAVETSANAAQQKVSTGKVDIKEAIEVGLIASISGEILGGVITKAVKGSTVAKVLDKNADRLARVARGSAARPTRQAAAQAAAKRASSYVGKRSAAASTAAASLTGKAVEAIDKKTTKKP